MVARRPMDTGGIVGEAGKGWQGCNGVQGWAEQGGRGWAIQVYEGGGFDGSGGCRILMSCLGPIHLHGSTCICTMYLQSGWQS